MDDIERIYYYRNFICYLDVLNMKIFIFNEFVLDLLGVMYFIWRLFELFLIFWNGFRNFNECIKCLILKIYVCVVCFGNVFGDIGEKDRFIINVWSWEVLKDRIL